MFYLTVVSDFFATASKKSLWSFYQRLFMSFLQNFRENSLLYRDFYKHQNVNKDSFFVGLWHPIIIAGRKTKKPRSYCFVLIAMFYTKEISYIFITLGNACDCDSFKIDKKSSIWDPVRKKLILRKRKWESKLFERGFAVLFTYFSWAQISVHIISTGSPNNRRREVWYPSFNWSKV